MANIITGYRILFGILLLFILPLTLAVVKLKYSGVFCCVIATVAAVQEGHLIRTEN